MTEASINEFVASECEFGRAFRIPSAELYGAYEQWCQESGRFPASKQMFGRQIGDRTSSWRTNQQRFRIGIRLRKRLTPLDESPLAELDTDVGANDILAATAHLTWTRYGAGPLSRGLHSDVQEPVRVPRTSSLRPPESPPTGQTPEQSRHGGLEVGCEGLARFLRNQAALNDRRCNLRVPATFAT